MKKFLLNLGELVGYLFLIVFILLSLTFYSILADIIFRPEQENNISPKAIEKP